MKIYVSTCRQNFPKEGQITLRTCNSLLEVYTKLKMKASEI